MRNKWDFFGIGLITLIGMWGIFGLWQHPGLPTSHDSISHLARMYAYVEGLKDGIFPVLWAKRLYWGIGSPTLMLNYQIPYYFAMIWKLIGLNMDDSFKAVLSFSYVASGILMYLTLRIRYKPLAAIAGAAIYLMAPYRYLNLYVRAALGEVFSGMFVPIILAGLWKKSGILQTVGWTGLFLSHPVGSAIYSGIFLVYQILSNEWKNILRVLKEFFLPYLLAIMIASFNLLPTLALTKYTYYTSINSHSLSHFPTFKQLIYSKWGYGFSTEDGNDGMSFQIGIVQWVLAMSAIGIIVAGKTNDKSKWELKYLIFIYVITFLLMIKSIASPIYTYLQLGKIIDFPWRLLMIYSFITALMAANIVDLLKTKFFKIILVTSLIFIAFYTNRNHVRINDIWPWPSTSFRKVTGDAFGEYASKWRQTKEGLELKQDAEIISGEGYLEIIKNTSNTTSVATSSDQPMLIRFNSMYFPGWKVKINNVGVNIDDRQLPQLVTTGCFVTIRNALGIDDSGLIECYVPSGENKIELKYSSMPIQIIGNILSLIGISILIYLASFPVKIISKIPTKRPRS